MARVIIEQDELENVVGGALSINGHDLDMNKTVAELEVEYGIDGSAILGGFYNLFKTKTLTQICASVPGGETAVQNKLNEYVTAHPEMLNNFPAV